jgi:hypothetical protein
VAGVLDDALPVDAAAVERGLRELLDGIDALAGRVAGEAAVNGGGLRLALVAALAAGAPLLLIDPRRLRGGPVLVFGAAGPSWSRCPGSATRKRARGPTRRP